MRNLFCFILASCYLMWMPAQVQAAEQGKAAKASSALQSTKAGKRFRDCEGCPEMVVIPSGRFNMGSPDSEEDRNDDEGPVHQVKITTFALGKTEITRGQFATFVNETRYNAGDKCWAHEGGKYEERNGHNWRKPAYPQGDKHPVTCVSWDDAKAYTKWLSGKTGKRYRLPTASEWEYSARGNTSTSRYWGDNPDMACRYANVADKTAQAKLPGASSWSVHNCTDGYAYTAPVGSFNANGFGLNDMLGNLWEWTEDRYFDSYEGAPVDGGARQGDSPKFMLRGGSWNNGPRLVRAAKRVRYEPGFRGSVNGFRVARKLP